MIDLTFADMSWCINQ